MGIHLRMIQKNKENNQNNDFFPTLPEFYCSYQYWYNLRMYLLLSCIEFIECCKLDSQFDFIDLKSFLVTFEKNKTNINLLSHFLKNNCLILNDIGLSGICSLFQISDHEGMIHYKTSCDISQMLIKIMPFIKNNYSDIQKDIERLNELFICSHSNKIDIQID